MHMIDIDDTIFPEIDISPADKYRQVQFFTDIIASQHFAQVCVVTETSVPCVYNIMVYVYNGVCI